MIYLNILKFITIIGAIIRLQLYGGNGGGGNGEGGREGGEQNLYHYKTVPWENNNNKK